jgi:hypothetical protein
VEPWETIADRFEIEEEAAAGGMGTVYRARDLQTGEPVAVKVLRHESLDSAERFEREAAVVAGLSHAGIVRYVAHGTTIAGVHYLVTEWIDGETLADKLERDGLTCAEAVELIHRAALALAEAHRRGVVHRDIKPSNLIFAVGDPAGIKIIDFGLARQAVEGDSLTATGVMLGTPGYMAPEQARAARGVDARADVFALGCVLYECLTGVAAFAGDNLLGARAKILMSEPVAPREVAAAIPQDLEALVLRMLAKDPTRRPADAAAVATALAALSAAPATPRHRVTDRDPASSRSRVRRPVAGVADVATREARVPQLMLSVVVAAVVDDEAVSRSTVTPVPEDERERLLHQAVDRHGGHLEILVDGGIVIVLDGTGVPESRAGVAARCALALRPLVPDALIAIATEQGPFSYRVVDELIDRAVREITASALGALFQPPSRDPPILLDALTARLLAADFEIGRRRSAYFLVHEGPRPDAP